MNQIRTGLAVLALVGAGLLSGCLASPAPETTAPPAAGKRVTGARGMVAASQPDAAAAGAAILQAGGNAVDAAVATAFALSVTDVSQTGLGGGGGLLYFDVRRGLVSALSFYPRTGADSAWSLADTATRPPTGPRGRAAGVPGMVAGLLEAHERFGRLPRAQVMAPAIRLAEEGFVVTPLLARTIASARQRLETDSLARARFLPGGNPLRPGDRLVQPELAATLRRIADGGRDAFYRGPVAAGIASAVQAAGGLITEADLASYRATTPVPLCAAWRGFTLVSAPPPLGGASVLALLQMSEAAGVTAAGGFTDRPAAVTTFAGVQRAVHADAQLFRGDPAVLPVPARGFSSARYAVARAPEAATAPDSARQGNPWAYEDDAAPPSCAAYPVPRAVRPAADPGAATRPSAADAGAAESLTSHLAVVDADGNAVSATTTVGVLFGSGVQSGGFFLNSSASNFDARTRGPERYANSTIAPTIVLDGARVRLVIGAAGSQYIQPSIAQVTLRILAWGEDPGAAIAAPRIHSSWSTRDVEVEPGFTSDVYAALVARGFRPLSRVADIQFGGVHAVYVGPDGRRIGIADPRRDGTATAQ